MLPGERDNARNNARCMQARKTKHGLGGQHQDVDRTPRGRVNQNDKRAEINGESSLRPWCDQPSFWLKNSCSRRLLFYKHTSQVVFTICLRWNTYLQYVS